MKVLYLFFLLGFSSLTFAQEKSQSTGEESEFVKVLSVLADGIWERVKYRLNLEDGNFMGIGKSGDTLTIGKYEFVVPEDRKRSGNDKPPTDKTTKGNQ